jgi:hypothetical protein
MSNAIPEDLRDKHERLMRLSKGSKSQARWASIWLPLIERIAAVEAERDALKAEFDDCVKHLIFLQPAQSADEWGEPIWRLVKPRMDALKAELVTARRTIHELQCELRQERGLKALLANGMPPTGNDDFDKVLATHPIAAMIQRGWLPGVTGFDDLPALESAICHFWAVKTIAECVNPPLIAARKDANDKEEA